MGHIATTLAPRKNIVHDDFDRPDSNNIGAAFTGQTWIQQSGVWGITGNQAYKVSGANFDQTLIDAKMSDGLVSVDVIYRSSTNTGGLAIRNLDNNNFIHVILTGTVVECRKTVAGTATLIGSFTFAPVDLRTYKLTVKMQGNNIVVYLDGVEVLNISESFNSTQTKHGLRSPGTTHYFKNFRVMPI